MRPYRLYYNGVWKSYKNLAAACWELAVQLYNQKCLHKLLQGTFEPTFYKDKAYYKQYVIEIKFPYTKWVIKKMTKGDLDQEETYNALKLVEQYINERISSEN